MGDRRRLLVLSSLILTGVAVVGSVVTGLHALSSAGQQVSGLFVQDDPLAKAACLAAATTLIVAVAGGTLLLRIVNPFIFRLEQSEARVRAILNTAGDGILIIDEQGVVESFNLASERMFACSAEAAAGRQVSRFIEGFDWPESGPHFSLDPMQAAVGLKGRKLTGETFPLELSLSEFGWGQSRSFTVIVRDVTERRAAEELTRRHVAMLQEISHDLETKNSELARINRELDDFTYVASHDLKEPLRGIGAYCQILLDDYSGKLDADGQRRLSALVGLCRRLSQLIDDLLAYSRIGRTAPAEQSTDLNQVARDVLQILDPTIEERRATVLVLEPLPIVAADPTMLGEVFRNLIANGLKFNEQEHPRVEIGAVDSHPPAIYVRDNGIGIAPQYHEAVFTMFRRLHSRRKYDGTGAGLTFVRKMIEAHGGRVWVESEEGRGSTFYFTLAGGKICVGEEAGLCAVG